MVSSFASTIEHTPPPPFSFHPLLRHRPSLHDFRTKLGRLEGVFLMGNRKPYSIDEQLRGAVSKLKYHVAEPYYGWSELPLQMRSTLVAKVLPEIEALKDETLNTRREHLGLLRIQEELNKGSAAPVQVLNPHHKYEGPSIEYMKEFAEQEAQATGGMSVLTLDVLADLTHTERDMLGSLRRNQYTPEERLLITLHESDDQAEYDKAHPPTRNPLLSNRPPVSDYQLHLNRHFVSTVHDAIKAIAQHGVYDTALAPAWESAMLREFNQETLASLDAAERAALLEYLGGCEKREYVPVMNPQKILQMALETAKGRLQHQDDQQQHPHHLDHPFAPPARSLSHFHPRLNFRQAAYYGTTPGAFAEGQT